MLMNASERPARLHFEPNGFRLISPGNVITSAPTWLIDSGEPIELDMLRYWSVTRQEPYASCELATKRLLGQA